MTLRDLRDRVESEFFKHFGGSWRGVAAHWERLLQLPPKGSPRRCRANIFVGQMNQPLLAQGVIQGAAGSDGWRLQKEGFKSGAGLDEIADMHLNEVVGYLDELLGVPVIGDYPNALNGLQVQNSGGLSKIGAAVDACEAVIGEAAAEGVDFLLVHHGLFWGGLAPLSGAAYRKTRMLLEADMAVYSAHLPLDVHPRFGNNALLADALGLENGEPFFTEFGQPIGWKFEAELNREVLRDLIEQAVGGRVHLAPGGPVVARKIGIVTGGAGGAVDRAVKEGVDTFITGEGPHWSFNAAEELGINLFYAGHYASETFGVKALAEELSKKFALPWQFIDHPTGL